MKDFMLLTLRGDREVHVSIMARNKDEAFRRWRRAYPNFNFNRFVRWVD